MNQMIIQQDILTLMSYKNNKCSEVLQVRNKEMREWADY